MKKLNKAEMKAVLAEIAELDDSIKLVHEKCGKCGDKNQPRYVKVLDRLLDERLELMAKRDQGKPKKVAADA